MSRVSLRNFDNSWYQPGGSWLRQAAWFFFGLPILRSSLIPSSCFRVFLLRLFGARIGERAVIKPGVRIKYPWNFRTGDDCWLGEDCWIDNLAPVELGTDVCISQGAYLCTGNHDWNDPNFSLKVGPITLLDGSWVGARAVIAPGITLRPLAIAAAGSVVTRDIPESEIYAGNPARLVRHRHLGQFRESNAASFSGEHQAETGELVR